MPLGHFARQAWRHGCSLALVTACVTACAGTRVRVATFNASLYRNEAGQLGRDLLDNDPQALAIAAVVQHTRPDILLLTELDRSLTHDNAGLLESKYFAVGPAALPYPYRYAPPVNTGVATHLDLDGDGRSDGPGDAKGFGAFTGQYAFALFSRWPIDLAATRCYADELWALQPDNLMRGASLPDGAATRLPLSSKNHCDIVVETPAGNLHLLASHPTPPVFDGPEDRNGRRNHDEIAFWTRHIATLDAETRFVVLGDLNADPWDGAARHNAIRALLAHPRTIDPRPISAGAVQAAQLQGFANTRQRGPAALDTADFPDQTGPGNLRVDYVLPSSNLRLIDSGVFWPTTDEPDAQLGAASDHHLVWVEVDLSAYPRVFARFSKNKRAGQESTGWARAH